MATSTISPQVIQQVLNIVDAYVQEFQPPLTPAFLTQIIETALPQLRGVQLNETSIKQRLIQEALAHFSPLLSLTKVLDEDSIQLAKTVHQNITNFKPERGVEEALNVLDAYIQTYKPSLIPAALYPIVKTILPQLKGLKLNSDKVERLAIQTLLKFSPELVPTKILSPQARAIARLVAQQIQNFQPQTAVLGVLGVLDAYVQQTNMTPTEATLYQIAKQVIPQMVKMAMSDDQKEKFATQVMFEFRKRPEPIKSPNQAARDIAAKLVDQLTHLQVTRAQELKCANVTQPLANGDLAVESAFIIQP